MGFRLRKPSHIQPGSWLKCQIIITCPHSTIWMLSTPPCSTHTHQRLNWINALRVLIAQFEMGCRKEQWSNLRMSCYVQPTKQSPSITSAVLRWCSFYRLSHYCSCQPSSFWEKNLWATDEPVVTRKAHLAGMSQKTLQEVAHAHYTLPEAENCLAVNGGKMELCFFFFFPIAFSRVISPSTEAQILVHQGEQSHVIGCFPTWAPDSTKLITNWWEIH